MLVSLKSLDCSMNKITSMDGLEKLENLESLYLDYNMIESIPKWFPSSLKNLQTFSITNNKFKKVILSTLRNTMTF